MKIILILLLSGICIFAQDFKVEKISGKVMVLKGTSEKFIDVKKGEFLNGKDMIVTEANSTILLSQKNETFLLKDNSAIFLNSIKKLTLNELLLALAMEDVKNVPTQENSSGTKSTATYGTKNDTNKKSGTSNGLGLKRLNGAHQLAEHGYPESSILFAKETFRKYPGTQAIIKERLYFAGMLEKLSLNEEALSEYSQINNLDLSQEQKEVVNSRIKLLSAKNN